MAGISFSDHINLGIWLLPKAWDMIRRKYWKKTLNTVLKVKSGELAYERDSVGFEKPSFNWPLLAALREEALRSNSHLHVIDFGGSLGSILPTPFDAFALQLKVEYNRA